MHRFYIFMLLLCSLGFTKEITEWSPQFDISIDGDYCHYGEFDETPLYWEALWEPSVTDTPGGALDSGRANPWVPVNSLAFSKGKEYQWVGWNSGCTKYKIKMNYEGKELEVDSIGTWGDQIDNKGPGVYIPTWRDGAEGAYSLTMDDVGAMSFELSIELAIEMLEEFPWCKMGFAVKSDAMDDEEWEKTRSMALKEHEIINHSYDHLSATDLWQYFYHGDTITYDDPSIPKEIRGLVVDTSLDGGDEFEAFCERVSYKNGDPYLPESLFEKTTYHVTDYEADPTPDTEMNIWKNRGKIKGSHFGKSPASDEKVKILKVKCYKGWTNNCREVNVVVSKELIDTNIYYDDELKDSLSKISAVHEVVSYAFPYNQSSNELIRYIADKGYLSARGGVNWGEPLSGDFYDPFRLNYDQFFQLDEQAKKVWPDNPHMKLGLQQMPDVVVATKGYMIRQLHSVKDFDPWEKTSPDKPKWWGTMPDLLFKEHLLYLDTLRQEHKLFIAPPTEIVMYRLTANAAKKAVLTEIGDGYELSIDMDDVPEKYQDEISVIVVLDEPMDKCDAVYSDDSKRAPRYQPRKMDEKGYAWSISINPCMGDVRFGEFSPHVITNDANCYTAYKVHGLYSSMLRLTLPAGEYGISLCTIAGKVISNKSVVSNGGIMDATRTNHLANGVYFLEVHKGTERVLREKLIIK